MHHGAGHAGARLIRQQNLDSAPESLAHHTHPPPRFISRITRIISRITPARATPEEVMVSVGLVEKADSRVCDRSGGQRRRLDAAPSIVGAAPSLDDVYLRLIGDQVQTHLLRIFTKLGVDDRTATVTVAMGRGLLGGRCDPEPRARRRRPSSVPRRCAMRRRLLAGLAVLVSGGLVLSGCGAGGDDAADGGVLRADVARLVSSADTAPLVEGMAAFGHDLLVATSPTARNLVVSPLSIAIAFSMARAGAAGPTAQEIDQVLHFPAADRDAAMNALTRSLRTQDAAPPQVANPPTRDSAAQPADPILTVANGLFTSADLGIRQQYLNLLAAQYGAGLRTVDFGTGEGEKVINAWVRKQTANRIDKLFDSLAPDVQLVLANAVYLKADWGEPFLSTSTAAEAFALPGGGSTPVPMMHRTGSMRYASGAGWQAVELTYAGGRLAMWVLVPAAGRAPIELLDPAVLSSVRTGLTERQVQLALPRWDFASKLELADLLQQMGVHAAFSDGAADFSGIAPSLYIDDAIHRANITVDESGTEAAAVTGISMKASGAMQLPLEVRADRPFAFAITDLPTAAPVFLGTVADPTANDPMARG